MSVEQKIHQIFGRPLVNGDIGIEIEVEGKNLPRVDSKYWRTERDSSLKAAEAYEYVLKEPIPKASVVNALAGLNRSFASSEAVVDDSYRAGVHIHINIGDLTLRELANFVTLTICFESILSDYCGESRKANLFCLRVKDAEQTLEEWLMSFRHMTFSNQNAMKYGFVNLATVGLYGSLEFRGMYSTTDRAVLIPWIDTLYHLKEYAKTFDNPPTIIESFSTLGDTSFCEEGLAPMLAAVGSLDSKDLWGDVRRAQEFAFGLDWEALCRTYLNGN